MENGRQKKRQAASQAPGESRHPTPEVGASRFPFIIRVFFARVNTLVTCATHFGRNYVAIFCSPRDA